jgi:hypothetical protein
MDAIIHDLLLFVSLAAAPVIFGFLLYLGLHISDHEVAGPLTHAKGEQKHPRRL